MSKMLAFYGLSRLLGGRRRAALCKSTYCGATRNTVGNFWRNICFKSTYCGATPTLSVKKYCGEFLKKYSWSHFSEETVKEIQLITYCGSTPTLTCRLNNTKYSILNSIICSKIQIYCGPRVHSTVCRHICKIFECLIDIYYMILWHTETQVTQVASVWKGGCGGSAGLRSLEKSCWWWFGGWWGVSWF